MLFLLDTIMVVILFNFTFLLNIFNLFLLIYVLQIVFINFMP